MAENTQPTDWSSVSEQDRAFLRDLKQWIRSQGEAFLADPNINSVGIGFKVKDAEGNRRTNELSVQFTVDKKGRSVPEMEMLAADMSTTPLPGTVTLPSGSIKTDVVERRYQPSVQIVAEREAVKEPRKQRLDTIVPGVSIGHPTTTAGTAGAIVYDRRTGDACVLSNWHVLHTGRGAIGDPMVQPGPYDDDSSRNRAGTLVRSHLGHAGDCAIARIEGRGHGADVVGLDGAAMARIGRPDLHDRVVKSGRTTGVTYGIVRRVETVARLDYGAGRENTVIGCFEVAPDEQRPAAANEISRGGDSGSVWLVADDAGAATDIAVGLHFGGEGEGNTDEHALACYVPAVFEKLEVSFEEPGAGLAALEVAGFGDGFDIDFLMQQAPFPRMTDSVERDVLKVDGSHLIPYTHFTVCMSRSRRMARFVAWNVDGNRLRAAKRTGFRFDDRLEREEQIGNDVYQNNKLDRGHIARRADLIWGGKKEAEQANYDSAFYTNIAPQHQAFNQSERAGLWGELENEIYAEVDVHDLRVSVIAGPILKTNDPPYEGIRIPRRFWKLIAYVDDVDKAFKARAYVLTQDDLLHDIEAMELDEFKLFQVSIADLEKRTGLRFNELRSADTFVAPAGPEGIAPAAREITSRAEIVR